MLAGKTEDLLQTFREMTLLELSEFVKAFEETFDVTAATPMMTAVPATLDTTVEAEPEQSEFSVILNRIGDKKIQVIKVVRALTGLGLKEAKDLVESVPVTVLERVDEETRNAARAQLEAEGAQVVVK